MYLMPKPGLDTILTHFRPHSISEPRLPEIHFSLLRQSLSQSSKWTLSNSFTEATKMEDDSEHTE
jgi:hypothetical protein